MNIIYRRVQSTGIAPVKVEDDLGRPTTFGDVFAWTLFVEGASRSRRNGVEISVFDIDGKCLVGTVDQLDDGGASPQ